MPLDVLDCCCCWFLAAAEPVEPEAPWFTCSPLLRPLGVMGMPPLHRPPLGPPRLLLLVLLLLLLLFEPSIELDVVDEADESSLGEQVAPSECELAWPSGHSARADPIRPPSASSRLASWAALGVLRRNCIQG